MISEEGDIESMIRSVNEIIDKSFKNTLERIPIFIKEKKHKKYAYKRNLKSRKCKKWKKVLRFCFRVNEKVGLAEDEEGNKAEAFICAKAKGVPSYTVPKEEYKDMQDAYRKLFAHQLECGIEMLEPITLNEYLDNVDDYEEEEEE